MRVISASAPVSGFEMMLVSALFMSSALSSTGFRPRPDGVLGGWPPPVVVTAPNPWSRSAAEPVTIGVAPEVPPNGPVPVPDPAMAETEAPGAPISGLIRSVFSCCGPRDEEPTIVPFSWTPTLGSNFTTVFGRPAFRRFEFV